MAESESQLPLPSSSGTSSKCACLQWNLSIVYTFGTAENILINDSLIPKPHASLKSPFIDIAVFIVC